MAISKKKKKVENFSIDLSLINKFFSEGVIDEEEKEFLTKEMAKKNGLSDKSIFVRNDLITTLINESICIEKGTNLDGN